MRKILFIIACLSSAAFGQAWSGILDPARAIDWTTAGVPGGIPSASWTQSGSTITATGSDQTAQINTAINACGVNHFVLLASGTFRINGTIVMKSNCVLRGQGANLTILDAHGTSGNVIDIGTGSPSTAQSTNITSGSVAGATSFTVNSATFMVVGKLMVVNELNDSSYVTSTGQEGNCNFCDDIGWGGTRMRGQIVKITNVAGTTISFSPALYSTFTLTPLATPYPSSVNNAGVENLQVLANNTGYGISFHMRACDSCWLRGVEGNYADGDHVQVEWSLHNSILDSYFSNAYLHTPGTHDSDVGLIYFTTASLVQNNILERLHISLLLERGVAGNVVAYNYSHGDFDAGSFNALYATLGFHGAHPQFNLLEGNVDDQIYPDSVWGSSSHNTVFRSWAIGTSKVCNPLSGRGAVSCTGANGHFAFQASRSIQVSTLNTSWNFVGSVLGSTQQAGLKLNGTGSAMPQTASILWNTNREYDTRAYGWSFGYSNLSDGGTVGTGCTAPCLDTTTPATTVLQHGNYNNIDGSLIWSGSLTHTLPASFYLASQPSWWHSPVPYPAIGPDVTTGTGPGGHVFSVTGGNPAQFCFSSNMAGTDGGEGSPYTFNADSCYAPVAPPPPPTTAGALVTGSALITGAMTTAPMQPVTQVGDFVAALPLNWVNSHACDAPGGVYDTDITLGTLTIAGLLTAVNAWQADVDKWERIKIPAGTNLHGSSYDGNNALITMPTKVGATKCLVIESTTPLTTGQIACSHGLPGYGGTRNPGCSTDLSKMWTFTADSTPQTGNDGMFFPFGSNHIVVRDAEFTIAKGAYQSASGVKVNIMVEIDGDHEGLERSYIHGYDPGDSGQPGGACSGWTMTGKVTTAIVGGSFTSVTWVSDPTGPGGKELSKRFGMTFSDGVHSPGYPQATININGINYTITSHDPAVSDTTLNIGSLVNNPSPVAYTLTNPPTVYANGCGDDQRSIQMNGDNIWAEWNYFEKIHWNGSESHAISSGFSNGPVKIAHNWVEAGSAGYFSGGAQVDTKGGPANDVEIRGNFFGRDLGWRFISATSKQSPHPPFGCGPLDQNAAHDNCPINWAIKNNMEMKLGHRILIDGNIVDGDWADGQSGYPLLQTVRTISGGSTGGIYDPVTGRPLTAIDNVRFSNNWVRNSPQVFQLSTRSLSPGNGGGMGLGEGNLDYINNVISNVNDDKQFGSPGPDLFQWAASGNTFVCNMTRSLNIAHAVCLPIRLTNSSSAPAGVFSGGFDITNMQRTGGVVTVTTALRHDFACGISACGTGKSPFVSQVTITGVAGWNGTFNVSATNLGTKASPITTRCTTDLRGNAVPAAIAVGGPGSTGTNLVDCLRDDGTFSNAFSYADAQGADGTLCSSAGTCNPDTGAGEQVTTDTLAYRITDIVPGDAVYTHDCTDVSFTVGTTTSTLALSPTSPTGLDVYYPNSGVDVASGVTCQLENSAGWPKNATYQFNTVLTPGIMSIGSNGKNAQHLNNRFYHNVFALPSGSNAVLACTGVGAQGSAVYPCWDANTFNFYDNVIVDPAGTRASVFTPYPLAAAANTFPANGTTILTGVTLPTTDCTFDGSSYVNCPLMAQPWSSNFSLANMLQLPQGANLSTLQDAFTRTIYVCPTGANCGTLGPSPD